MHLQRTEQVRATPCPAGRAAAAGSSGWSWMSGFACDSASSVALLTRPSAVTASANRSRVSAKCLINGGNSVSTRSRVSLRCATIDEQPVRRVDRAGDVLALVVQLGGEGVQPAEELADLIPATRQDVGDLGLDDLEVRDAAAGEDGADAGQRPLRGGERRLALDSGMVSPLFSSWPTTGPSARRARRAASRAVTSDRSRRVVSAGSLRPGSTSSVSVATQFFSSIARTLPTKTSATRTRLLTLSANVSGIWT